MRAREHNTNSMMFPPLVRGCRLLLLFMSTTTMNRDANGVHSLLIRVLPNSSRSSQQRHHPRHHLQWSPSDIRAPSSLAILSTESESEPEPEPEPHMKPSSTLDDNRDGNHLIRPLMDLASAHFTSQALHAFVKLGIPDLMQHRKLSLKQISALLGDTTNEDALLRTFRLLVSAGILEHFAGDADDDAIDFFRLTGTGALLRTKDSPTQLTQPSMTSGILHWMEAPLWDAWLHLPPYIQGTMQPGETTNLDPFQRCNGISSDFYYNVETHPKSLQYANDFVRFIHHSEIEGIVSSLDWSQYEGKSILDIGGYDGRVLDAISSGYRHISFQLTSLDLPNVIQSISNKSGVRRGGCGSEHAHVCGRTRVKLIGGNVMEPSTLPPSDVILMKHFLDRCMWSESETVHILKTCRDKIPANGQVILADAVIPDFDQIQKDRPESRGENTTGNGIGRVEVAMDALYMIVGRERQRTRNDWTQLVKSAGFRIKDIIPTMTASCSLIILEKSE